MSKTVKLGNYDVRPGLLMTIAKAIWETNPDEFDEDWDKMSAGVRNDFINEFVLPIPKALKAQGFDIVRVNK